MKTLPHNLDAEQAVLGAIVLDPRAYDDAEAVLSRDDFYDPLHQRIWGALSSRIAAGRKADAIALESALRDDEGFKDIAGGASRYLAVLIEASAPEGSLVEYARIVADAALRRAMIRRCTDAISESYGDHDRTGAAIAAEVEGDMARLQSTGSVAIAFSTSEDGMDAVTEEVERARTRQGITGIKTGFRALDSRTGGLQRSNLVILAGRPSMGKTAVVGNIVMGAAKQARDNDLDDRQRVGMFSIEMTKVQVWMRSLVSECRALGGYTSLSMLRKGVVGRGDEERIEEAKQRLRRINNIRVDESRGLTVSEIRRRCRAMSREMDGLDLVAIDYLSLIQKGDFKGRNEASVIGEITWALKNLAGELDVPVVLLSQLSRGVESRDNKRPMLSDLRDSGAIEQDADDVFFVYRDAYYKEREVHGLKHGSDARKTAETELQLVYRNLELICAKQRQGPIGTDLLHYEAEFNYIRDMEGEG